MASSELQHVLIHATGRMFRPIRTELRHFEYGSLLLEVAVVLINQRNEFFDLIGWEVVLT